jgi:hypothetical protein
MPRIMARSAPSTTVWAPEVPIAVCTSRLACRQGGEARIFRPDRVSYLESLLQGRQPTQLHPVDRLDHLILLRLQLD